ncbi:MAG: C39 family peptidase [Bacilli bacterium]|nr:C39 family peptidase [Bacilli bacterium]
MYEENQLTEADILKQRKIESNANNVRALADMASKTSNPYAKAAGIAVKGADKLTGGKSSESLGKALDRANKFTPGGILPQNRMNKSGTSGRIASALNKKNNLSTTNAVKAGAKSNAVAQGKKNNFFSKREVEEQTSDGGGFNFKVTANVIKIGLISFAPVMLILVFMNLMVAGSQTYLKVIGLDRADKVADAEVEESIRENGAEGLDDEITDDDGLAYIPASINNQEDIFINNNISMHKLNKYNFISKVQKTEYSEADLLELEDYYSVEAYSNSNYNMDTVYKFFFKLYYIQKHYKEYYNIDLDMPLIISVLSIESEDISNVFKSNIEGYKITQKKDNPLFDYYHDWSNYVLFKNSSAYDIEILAQHMVSVRTNISEEPCKNAIKDGKCYELVSEQQYKEFLKEFLEKKYFIGNVSISNNNSNNNTCSTTTPFVKYNLTDDQVLQLASLAIKEQGTVKGAAAEASLMANLFEIKGSKYGTGADGLYNYVRNSGWFASSKKHMDARGASPEVVAAVRSVLVDGKRTLPGYIDEHDWINDISTATTNGKIISKNDRASYIKNNTILKNVYGATYTFYSFPDTKSDPFGYTSEERRKEIGEFYYDYDTGNAVNCTKSNDPNYAEGVSFIDGGFGSNIYYYNQNDYQNYYFSKDPYNLAVHKTDYCSLGKGKCYQSIRSSGCAPTSLSIAISTLLNEAHDPVEVTAKFCSHDGCKRSGGNSAAFAPTLAEYGLKVGQKTKDAQKVSEALSSGNSIVIVSVGPGDFTGSGHYMALTGVNSKGEVFVADPNNKKKTKWWSFSRIIEQRKWFWIVSR